jgi:hypothetical protein
MTSERPNEAAEFDNWLHQRMKESNLTPTEMKDFADWLEIRQRDLKAEARSDLKREHVSTKEFFVLLSWLRDRFRNPTI